MQIRWRLPVALAAASLVFAGIVALTSGLVLRDVYLNRLEEDIALQVQQYSAVIQTTWQGSESPNSVDLQSLTTKTGAAGSLRLTVIAHDGKVLADSEADPATLENHATRPEVAQSLAGHEGRARRLSTTLNVQLVYVAEPMPASTAPWSKGVLRGAVPATRIDAMLAASWRVPLIVWAILLLPILAAGYFLTRGITRPLGRLRHMAVQVASATSRLAPGSRERMSWGSWPSRSTRWPPSSSPGSDDSQRRKRHRKSCSTP